MNAKDNTQRGECTPIKSSGPARALLITGGTLFVALALFGMFLPVLPTTPFLLLAAFCYARSSERFYNWLLNNRCFGRYIRNYREGKGIPVKQKVFTISLLWLTTGYAIWFVVSMLWLKTILTGIAIGVTIHLLRMKTLK